MMAWQRRVSGTSASARVNPYMAIGGFPAHTNAYV